MPKSMQSNDAANQPTRRRRWRRTLLAVSLCLAIAVGVSIAYAVNLGRTFDAGTQKIANAFPSEVARPPAATPLRGSATAQNILLLGSDTRGTIGGSIGDLTGQRSDTIMILHIPADRQNLFVMSILRDSWLEIPGHGQAKINAALSYGGVPLAVQTVEGLLDVRIDHVVVADFSGFKGVTDALGGVDVANPVGFVSSKIEGHYFAQGTVRMNGAEALAFVRERYAFADGDFQRVRNQQQFLKAVLSKALSASTLSNPLRVQGLVGAVAPYLAVDSGFNAAYVAGLAMELREVRVGDTTFFTLPTAGTGTSSDGQSIVNIDRDKLATLKQAFVTDALGTYTPEIQSMAKP